MSDAGKSQLDKIKEAARQLETGGAEERFEKNLKKMARQRQEKREEDSE